MGQYEIFDSEAGLLLDVQAGLLDALNTRIAVPLIPFEEAPKPAERLNPVFTIGDQRYVLATQFLAAVPVSVLRRNVGSLAHERYTIKAAIDLLFDGF